MKKFLLGLLCGMLLIGSSVAFASPSIQARLFSAVFNINGESIEPGTGYKVLEVDGRTYVPVRFIAENLGATVGYDADMRRILIRNGPLTVTDPDYPSVSVGNLIPIRSGKNTSITGQLQLAGVGNSKYSLEASLTFYDARNKKLGSATLRGSSFGVDTQTFTATGAGDFRPYQTVILKVTSENGKAIPASPPLLYENKEYGFTLTLPECWKGKYTVEKTVDSANQVASLRFIDIANQKYGPGGTLFTVQIWPKNLWEESGKSVLDIVPSWQIGETADRVYALIAPSDVQYHTQDETLSGEYADMSRYRDQIRTSFAAMP